MFDEIIVSIIFAIIKYFLSKKISIIAIEVSLRFAIRERGIEFADQTGQTKANGAFDRDP